MTEKQFALIAGVVFSLVAVLHILRIAQGWDLVAAGRVVPMSASWVGFAIAAVLGFFGLKLGCRKP